MDGTATSEERARRIASQAWDLPMLPEVAAKILERVKDPKSTAEDIAKVISRDPALTSKVLRMANSALFGLRQPVSSIRHAIVIMGFNAIRSLVMAATTQSAWRTKGSRLKDRLMWEHSLAVAIAARVLAAEVHHPAVEEAFVGGLVHDIGKLVMDRTLGDGYQNVLERVYNEGITFLQAENEVFGFDHAEVGALVVEKWNLPRELQETVRLHHQPMDSEIEPNFCAIVSLANSLCVKLKIGPERQPDMNLSELDSAIMLSVNSERLDRVEKELQTRLEEERELFET